MSSEQHQTSSVPVEPTVLDRFSFRILQFIHIEGASGFLLMFMTLGALFLANSMWSDLYFRVLKTPFVVGVPNLFVIEKPLLLWVNDGLMAIFFFVVGLELKREAWIGELSGLHKALLPGMAALGGMIVPVLFFWLINRQHPENLAGWGIPMATDIAFAVGVITLLRKRVPLGLVVFLTALAVVDDLGAILVIALFYTKQIHSTMLLLAGVFLVALAIYGRVGGRSLIVYMILGGFTWLAVLQSGIHATVAGVAVAWTIPVDTRVDLRRFSVWMRQQLDRFDSDLFELSNPFRPGEKQRHALHAMNHAVYLADSPLRRLEDALHPWVAFLIMPLFALANAGIPVDKNLVHSLTSPLALGILAGLLLGKPIGIVLFTWLAIRLRFGSVPSGVSLRHLLGTGILAGMGFTMSIFIATLSFDASATHAQWLGVKLASPMIALAGQKGQLEVAKMAILVSSTLAGVLGYFTLRFLPLTGQS